MMPQNLADHLLIVDLTTNQSLETEIYYNIFPFKREITIIFFRYEIKLLPL